MVYCSLEIPTVYLPMAIQRNDVIWLCDGKTASKLKTDSFWIAAIIVKSELTPIARAKFVNEIWYVIVCDVLTPKILPHCTEQWGYQSLTQTETQVTVPIACTFLQGVASDIGNAGQNPAVAIGIGFNGTQTIYLRADASTSRSVGSHYIIVGKAI